MIDFIKRLFGFSAKPVEAAPSAPYKVPEPAATTPIPLAVQAPAPVEKAPAKAPAKPRAPAKPKAEAKPKAVEPKAKAPAKAKIKVVK